jgi:Na+/melibiose symporter-like transporter
MESKKSQFSGVADQDRVSWRIKLSFGIGQFGEGAKSNAFNFFLLFYYTIVLGLSGTLAGTALLIALLCDGFSDPLMGSISDASNSRWGRRHPFMYIAAIPFGVCFFLVFSPPAGLGQIPLFLWLMVLSILCRAVFMTMYTVPHMAMNAELTQNYTERTSLAAWRMIFSNIGGFLVVIGGFFYFFRSGPNYSNGQLNPMAYSPFGLFFAIAMIITLLICALGTHSEIPKLRRKEPNVQPLGLRRMFYEIKNCLCVRPFRIKIIAGVVFSAMFGTMLALAVVALTYFWGLSPKQVGMVLMLAIVFIIIGAVFARPISTLIGEKRDTYMIALAWFAVWTCSSILLRLTDLLPPNGHWIIFPLVAGTNAIAYAATGVTSALTPSMIADCTDEHERIYSVRQEGIYYGALSLLTKASSGFGAFMAGIITDITGIGKFAKQSIPDPSALLSFGLIWGPLPLVMGAIAILIIWRYDIDQARHNEILVELKSRNSSLLQPQLSK